MDGVPAEPEPGQGGAARQPERTEAARMLPQPPHESPGPAGPVGEPPRRRQLAMAPAVGGHSQQTLQPQLDSHQRHPFGFGIGGRFQGEPGAGGREDTGDHGGFPSRGPAVPLPTHRYEQGARLTPVELEMARAVGRQPAPLHHPVEHQRAAGFGQGVQPPSVALGQGVAQQVGQALGRKAEHHVAGPSPETAAVGGRALQFPVPAPVARGGQVLESVP